MGNTSQSREGQKGPAHFRLGASNSYRPGTLVPNATNVMAVTASSTQTVHPKWDATSPMIAVSTPIQNMETVKVQ